MHIMNKKSRRKNSQNDKREIGRRIRELRGFDMTQEDFAERLGVSQSTISRLERGDIPTVDLLLKISKMFNKPTDWILKGEE